MAISYICCPTCQSFIHFSSLQVDSPLNLKHPHDVVIFMRQETRVNYLKKLEVCRFNLVILQRGLKICVFNQEIKFKK